MTQYLKQSTATTVKLGPFLDDTDGKTAETGLTLAQADVKVSKNGATMATKNSSTATTHDALGYYNVHLSTTDTDTLGSLKVMVSKEGALPVWAEYSVLHAKAYDAMFSTGLVELVAAYDAAKTAATQASVNAIPTTPLLAANYTAPNNQGIADIKAKTDQLVFANNKVNANADLTGIAKTTDLSPLAKETNATANKNDIEAILTAIKGAGWTDETLKAIMEAVEAIGGGSGGDTAEQIWAYANRTLTASPTDLTGIAKTSDSTPLAKTTDLANVAKKTDIPTDYAKKTDVPTVAQNQNGLAKTTDLTGVAKTSEVEAAKNAIIGAMPELDVTQLEGKLDDVKGKTDQLQFTAGKVNANATVDLDTSDIAKQSTSEQILAMFAEAQIAIIGNVQDGKITAIRGNDWELVIPCELPDDAKIQMAVKNPAGVRDDQSAIFVDSETGLIYLDKDNGNAADGSLVYADGNLTLTLAAAATAKLCAGNFRYGIQSVSAAGKVVEKYQGDFIIYNDIVKATS